jgi:nucleoside-diphosphate kinase
MGILVKFRRQSVSRQPLFSSTKVYYEKVAITYPSEPSKFLEKEYLSRNSDIILSMKVNEKTLILIKPDVLRRAILGKVIQKFEEAGLKIIAVKTVNFSTTQAKKFYPGLKSWKIGIGEKVVERFQKYGSNTQKELGTTDPLKLGEKIYDWSIKYLTTDKTIAFIVEGPHAIDRVKQIIGPTEPMEAPRGTIRGDYCTDSIVNANLNRRVINNLVHRSTNKKDAKREIKLLFKKTEVN